MKSEVVEDEKQVFFFGGLSLSEKLVYYQVLLLLSVDDKVAVAFWLCGKSIVKSYRKVW